MKKAVMIGAGNIGRGFIAQIFHDSGYEVVFVDIDEIIVGKLNKQREYVINFVERDYNEQRIIDNVRAVNSRDTKTVAAEIASCDILATAVGKNALPLIAFNLAEGIKLRFMSANAQNLNILICENLANASGFLRTLLENALGESKYHLSKVGLVETTVGRMVPVPEAEAREKDPTAITVEPFCELPVDIKAMLNPMPELLYIKTFEPFAFFEEKKLLIHNMGHALCAYLGFLEGYKYIFEAADDEKIRYVMLEAMRSSALAISKQYKTDSSELFAYAENLIYRFCNPTLRDTVVRVGQDPLRKLAPDDRLVGALKRCKSQNTPYNGIIKGIAASLLFFNDNDPSAEILKKRLKEEGIDRFLIDYSGISAEDIKLIIREYNTLIKN